MGTNTTEVINQSRAKRDYPSLATHINGTGLDPRTKTELLVKLSQKRRTLLQGAVFMMKSGIKFDHLDRALIALEHANNAYALGAVEAALQAQIDAVCSMDDSTLPNEKKALCLYALQNMIFALGDFQLANGKENDYMPHILQDQYQMLLRGSNLNMNWNELYNSSYSGRYRDMSNPELADFKFLDINLIKSNMKAMAHNHPESVTPNKSKAPTLTQYGSQSWDMAELKEIGDEKINKIINKAMLKFDKTDLKNNLGELYNFVKDAMAPSNSEIAPTDYQVLHEVVVASIQRIVEIGSSQQRKKMLAQQEMGGMSL